MNTSERKVYHFHCFQDMKHLDGFIELGKVTGDCDYKIIHRAIGKKAVKAGMDPDRITIASLAVVGNAL